MSLQVRFGQTYYHPFVEPPLTIQSGADEVTREIKSRAESPAKKSSTFLGGEITGAGGTASTDQLRTTANLYFVQGHYSKAVEALEQLIRSEPAPESYLLLGMSYQSLGNYLNAARALEEAARLRPDHVITQYHLGSTYLTYYIRTGDRNKLEKAVPPFKKLITLGERRDQAANFLGFIYDELDDWDNAEKYYLKSAKFGADPARTYQQLAAMYAHAAKAKPEKQEYYYLKAAEAFQKVIKHSPNNSDVYNFLGYVYVMSGKLESARRAFEKGVELDEHNLLALANLGSAYLNTGRYEEAKDIYQRIIRTDVEVIRSYVTQKLGRSAEDVNAFLADAYNRYGVACVEVYKTRSGVAEGASKAETNLLDDAEAAFKKAIEIYPYDGDAHYHLAALYYGQDRVGEAQDVVRQLLALDPDNEMIKDHVQKMVEEQLQQRLLARGSIKEIRKPITDLRPYQNRTMMTIRTKPLSELVIEGRR